MKKGTVFGGSLLIAGTTIGGGMLALPVLTSLSGFVPSLILYLMCWLFMASTGLLFLEVCLWMGGESNIVSMANKTLGTPGKLFAWFVYLFFFYCVTLAYMVGGGNLVATAFGDSIPSWAATLLFVLLFAPFVFAGAFVVDKINVFLMIGLVLSYLLFVLVGFPYVKPENLKQLDWSQMFLGLPVAFAAFGYQGIVPTLVHYMDFDVRKLRKAILIGSFIPLLTYVIWQWLILGIVPTEGPHGLQETLTLGNNAVYPLKHFIPHSSLTLLGEFFAFFALATSFFGVTLGMLDFLADGLQVEKTTKGRLLLCALIYIPPLVFSLTHPHVFLQALDFAGGFGSALLLGLLPILMVWSGRYKMGLKSSFSLPGGKPLLLALMAFVFFELMIELRHVFLKNFF